MAPVNPEGQTAREPKAEWRVVGAAANRCVNVATGDGDAVAIVYGNAAHLETAYQRAVAICAARNAGQTPQEVRRAALEEAAERVQRQPWWRDSGQAAAAIRALASTPSPAKQTEQKIADQKGGGANDPVDGRTRAEVTPGAASQLGAAPAAFDQFLAHLREHGIDEDGSCILCERWIGRVRDPDHAAAPAQPDARDAEIEGWKARAEVAERCATRLRAACEVVLVPNLKADVLRPIAEALDENCKEGL